MEACRLCLKSEPLVRSHILPELLYRPLYDSDGRAVALDGQTGRSRTLQKGLRENLLCSKCEALLQKSEDYFSKRWYRFDPLPDPVEGRVIERRNFDFDKYRRFFLSVLWRASVAERKEFSSVSLGRYAETIRQYLLGTVASPSPEPSIHGIVLRRPTTHELCGWIILQPVRTKINGRTVYRSVFGGCTWFFGVSNRPSPLPQSLQLQEPGKIILPVEDYTSDSALTKAWNKWRRSSTA